MIKLTKILVGTVLLLSWPAVGGFAIGLNLGYAF